jgi:hypothetical protein
MTFPWQVFSMPPGMLVVDLDVDVVDGMVVVYVGYGFGAVVVVPAVDDDKVPPAAYPKSARNRMNRMKPNAASVESLAMPNLDQCYARTLITTLCLIKP